MSAAGTAPMLSVYDDKTCIGFIIARGRLGFESFSADLVSLGTFPTQREAADAISEKNDGRSI
jgi:hypothetical protein